MVWSILLFLHHTFSNFWWHVQNVRALLLVLLLFCVPSSSVCLSSSSSSSSSRLVSLLLGGTDEPVQSSSCSHRCALLWTVIGWLPRTKTIIHSHPIIRHKRQAPRSEPSLDEDEHEERGGKPSRYRSDQPSSVRSTMFGKGGSGGAAGSAGGDDFQQLLATIRAARCVGVWHNPIDRALNGFLPTEWPMPRG